MAGFERQKVEQGAVVLQWPSPLAVVIFLIERVWRNPAASWLAVVARNFIVFPNHRPTPCEGETNAQESRRSQGLHLRRLRHGGRLARQPDRGSAQDGREIRSLHGLGELRRRRA